MATTAKDGSTLGKERRGTSPSNSHHSDTTHRKKSVKQSNFGSSDKDHATPSEKHVPHYLMPTISSRSEPQKHVRKHGPEHTTQKPSLNRRRSFDKPPSPSSIQKALNSPHPKEKMVRSLTIAPKATTHSMKPVSERLSKTPNHKVVKSPPPLSRPKSMKKTTTNSATKKDTTVEAKAPGTSDVSHTPNTESEHEDDSFITEVEEDQLLKVESEVEFPPELSISEDKEHVDVEETDVKNHEDEKPMTCDIPTVSEDQYNAPPTALVEETEDKIYDEENNVDCHVEEKQNKVENDNSHPEESLEDKPQVESDVKEGEEGATEAPKSKDSDEKEEVEEKSQGLNAKEEAGGVEEAKQEAENVVPKRQGGPGKKDSPAYNDVIEETASKLLEKRKNKVKALVGAFETVISLQEPEA